jgi:RimJ/RimL family protein N-acetyltransferase
MYLIYERGGWWKHQLMAYHAYKIRQTTREDWRELRALRLAALRDPVAPVAFYERYDKALRQNRREWERRAQGEHDGTVTFIGEVEDGSWGGMLSVIATSRCARVISVYMLPEHRGTGLAGELIRTAIAWAGGREVRLHVHENNPRAARFYAAIGFRPTGESDPDPRDPSLCAYELALKPDQPGSLGSLGSRCR